MDRLNPNSRYFRYNTTNGTGYIFATNQNGDEDGNRALWTHNNPDDNNITVGAPFHFYFGLKKKLETDFVGFIFFAFYKK